MKLKKTDLYIIGGVAVAGVAGYLIWNAIRGGGAGAPTINAPATAPPATAFIVVGQAAPYADVTVQYSQDQVNWMNFHVGSVTADETGYYEFPVSGFSQTGAYYFRAVSGGVYSAVVSTTIA